MLSHSTDRELTERWFDDVDQQEAIMAELYHRHAQRVYAYCRSMGGDVEANDRFQDAWLKLHAALGKGPMAIDHVDAYLLRIVRNQILNARRSTISFVTLDDVELAMRDRSYEQHEALVLLQQAMELLPDEMREAFALHEVEGMPYEAMQQATGETVATLRNRVWRARTRLRNILRPLLHDLDGIVGNDVSPFATWRTNDDES